MNNPTFRALKRLIGTAVLVSASLLASAQSAATSGTPNAAAPSGRALLDELHKGGLVLFLAHPELKPGRDEQSPGQWWKECFTTRGLSQAGATTASAIGKAMRGLVVVIQETRVSEFCRSLDTYGALGVAKVPPRTDAALNSLEAQISAGKAAPQAAGELRTLMLRVAPLGFNYLLIGDAPDPKVSPDPNLSALHPGETGIFRPTAAGKLIFVARLSLPQWQAMQADADAAAKAVTAASAPAAVTPAAPSAPAAPPPPKKPVIDPAIELKGADLVHALQKGGFVLHMRHGEATVGNDVNLDATPNWPENCEVQRNLSPRGKDDARKVGEAIRKLHIPIGQVYTSQFCRARDTAALMALAGTSTRLPEFDLGTGQKLTPNAAELRTKDLSTPPPAGTNTMIVSHVHSMTEVERAIADSTFAEIIVHKPDGKGGTVAVGRIKVGDWDELIKAGAGK